VHEAYIRLVDVETVQHWDSRGHFFAAAAEAMRRILVDRARHKETQRAGGLCERVDLEHNEPSIDGPSVDLIALNEALKKLAQKDPRKAELVKLRFFAGLSVHEAATCWALRSPRPSRIGPMPKAGSAWRCRARLRRETLGDFLNFLSVCSRPDLALIHRGCDEPRVERFRPWQTI